ncbi:hypothetical protein QAD02_024353 [Eretmocerus hayati]|uniref:Uncharacterized protein n=1 Tax=Eretmocerus hayati TaxID=131215 RepID=A0ACC2Q040_9HYME|nr:hypothetical protein QAD02_024353 [Eretmocerus hayati]
MRVVALLLFWLLLRQSLGDDTARRLQRRLSKRAALVYPNPSTLLLILGVGWPIQLERESVILGAFSKFIYTLPTNSTTYTSPLGNRVQSASWGWSRWSVYRLLEGSLTRLGLGDGRACLLRSICEAASEPFHTGAGVLQQLLQALLSPSSTAEAHEVYADREYEAAERLGRNLAGEHCHALYPECERAPLELLSDLAEATIGSGGTSA